jgi:hypothetical protein
MIMGYVHVLSRVRISLEINKRANRQLRIQPLAGCPPRTYRPADAGTVRRLDSLPATKANHEKLERRRRRQIKIGSAVDK